MRAEGGLGNRFYIIHDQAFRWVYEGRHFVAKKDRIRGCYKMFLWKAEFLAWVNQQLGKSEEKRRRRYFRGVAAGQTREGRAKELLKGKESGT